MLLVETECLWTAVQGSLLYEHQRFHTRLDLCAHCLDIPVSTDALLLHAMCFVGAPCCLIDKSALAGLLGWSAVLVGDMVLVGLSIRLWLDNWRSILSCWLRLNAWTAVQGALQYEYQQLHTRIDLCAHCIGIPVSTDALLLHATMRCLHSMLADRQVSTRRTVALVCSVSG